MINATEHFIKNYPLLFAQSEENPLGIPYWGMECGRGWFRLLERLCRQAQSHIDNKKCAQVVFHQIKEKYGKLCIHYSDADDFIDGLIKMAEEISAIICENCSSSGELVRLKGGWLKTVCGKCQRQLESKNN
ncbi:hypothetical protein WLF18_02415 [Pseudomonas shirazensis]|uniref:Uncharacterized protein n=1 Tax=Pseudomonas shirazensis TaxID=2745494 RepID=A0ABU8ZVC7_9PSED